MTAHPEPIYSARDQGYREALLQVRSFIAKHGKGEVDAFCAQALHDLRMDTLHWDAASQPTAEEERSAIVRYMRHMATLRPADAHGLGVIASDVEAMFHRDPELNPEGAQP